MSEFSRVPFAAGSLVGYRAFDVNPDGELQSPVQFHTWEPGVNEADCFVNHMVMRRAPADHKVGSMGCGCGFYAYYHDWNPFAVGGRIEGIVEGYGTCTVGDQGFRAQKMKILALVAPGNKSRGPSIILNLYFLLWTAWFAGCGVAYMKDKPAVAGTYWVCTVVFAGMWFSLRRLAGPKVKQVAKRYGVPVYRSFEEATKHHPVTTPEQVAPLLNSDQ